MAAVKGYPIEVLDVPTIWRGDPFEWVLGMGPAVDLALYGPDWASQARVSVRGAVVVTFAVDTSNISAVDADGGATVALSLAAADTAAIPYDVAELGADVQATGGAASPFTVWRLRLLVDGDYTR